MAPASVQLNEDNLHHVGTRLEVAFCDLALQLESLLMNFQRSEFEASVGVEIGAEL